MGFEKNFEELKLTCKKIIDLAPNWFLGYHALALTHYETKNFSNAIVFYNYAIQLNPDEDFYFQRGMCFKEIGEIEKYKNDINKSSELGSTDAEKEIENNHILFNPKKYYLFFDTETTGLPKNWKAPVTDFNNWPRLVQLAYILFDEDGKKIEENDFIIKPNGFTIPNDASKVHGITTEIANEEGYSIDYVLGVFQKLIQKSEYLVAHNISFDEKIMGCEFLRNDFENKINDKKKICTMEKTTNFCKLDGPYGYKWPKLSELHKILFGYDFEEAHNASFDIQATAKCFWELRKRNVKTVAKPSSQQNHLII